MVRTAGLAMLAMLVAAPAATASTVSRRGRDRPDAQGGRRAQAEHPARGKLRVEVTCPASCRVKARLISGRTLVASAAKTRLGAGLQVVRPKTSRRGRRLLNRRTKVGMTLVVDVRDDAGRTTTLTRILRFRR